ncbi:hypothetical protein RchiOBHm_Chr2g0162731 [Rosa chinensis]|uniref:Uncharacterized protein n=1 Tax=Rosa chinensis TaxID=74649 RepID=A0A2P6S349_ROSCH|nr:hypothetical protein RchiOBHm_Chr2g0162731 [Rosa chinensis]
MSPFITTSDPLRTLSLPSSERYLYPALSKVPKDIKFFLNLGIYLTFSSVLTTPSCILIFTYPIPRILHDESSPLKTCPLLLSSNVSNHSRIAHMWNVQPVSKIQFLKALELAATTRSSPSSLSCLMTTLAVFELPAIAAAFIFPSLQFLFKWSVAPHLKQTFLYFSLDFDVPLLPDLSFLLVN